MFTGCYTTQTRIKAANKLAEAALFEAEALSAFSPSGPDGTALFEETWRDVMFNQFHDILPGAGIPDTREYSLGFFQKTLARANTQKSLACYALAGLTDTSAITGGRPLVNESEGAGVGYGIADGHGLSRVERGAGMRRGYLLFNTAGEREDVATLSVWDWPGDQKALKITDSTGNTLPFQILEADIVYCQHRRTDIAVACAVPPMGWRLVVIDEDADAPVPPFDRGNPPQVHTPYEYILENEHILAEFDPVSGSVSKLVDKCTERLAAVRGRFSVFTESSGTHPAWVVGRYKNDEEQITIDKIEPLYKGSVRNAIKVSGRYKNSIITYVATLDKGARHLAITADFDWLEAGSADTGVPQLRFVINNVPESAGYFYDVPYGSVKRPGMDLDVPGLSYACSCPSQDPALAIISRDRYGYRCVGNTMALTLLRSSNGPDPYPELGRRSATFHLAVVDQPTPAELGALSMRLNHPTFAVSVTGHSGDLPAEYSLLKCDAAISGVKLAEDGSGDLIIRLYDQNSGHCASLTLAEEVESAHLCSLTEAPGGLLETNCSTVTVPMRIHGVSTVRVKLRRKQ